MVSDDNECSANTDECSCVDGLSQCSVTCVNTASSYGCVCSAGYETDFSGHTCKGRFIQANTNYNECHDQGIAYHLHVSTCLLFVFISFVCQISMNVMGPLYVHVTTRTLAQQLVKTLMVPTDASAQRDLSLMMMTKLVLVSPRYIQYITFET